MFHLPPGQSSAFCCSSRAARPDTGGWSASALPVRVEPLLGCRIAGRAANHLRAGMLDFEAEKIHRLGAHGQLLIDRETERHAPAVPSGRPLDRVVRRRIHEVDLLPVDRFDPNRIATIETLVADDSSLAGLEQLE